MSTRDTPPIDMVLFCPDCGLQHVDAPEPAPDVMPGSAFDGAGGWTNPPHRSHRCAGCGHIWRPADVPTNGVAATKTKGKADSPLAKPARRGRTT
jgi:rubredoxin